MNVSREEFAPYDTADYLTTSEDMAAYLEAALEDGGDDPAFIAHALGNIARSGNLSELARKVGMSREGLYKALSGEGNPSFATIMKVAKALGLRMEFHARHELATVDRNRHHRQRGNRRLARVSSANFPPATQAPGYLCCARAYLSHPEGQ